MHVDAYITPNKLDISLPPSLCRLRSTVTLAARYPESLRSDVNLHSILQRGGFFN